jgi:hypothetical protein
MAVEAVEVLALLDQMQQVLLVEMVGLELRLQLLDLR